MTDDIDDGLDRCFIGVDALHARIRELEAERDATIERCAKEAEGLAESISGAECERVCFIIAYLIRALKAQGKEGE